jgi:hypothetical protein
MARLPTKVRLQKTLKEGLRRCVYRRWEAEVQGSSFCSRTIDLERMYRGNTPHPIGKPKVGRKPYPNRMLAEAIILQAKRRRLASGYRPYTD